MANIRFLAALLRRFRNSADGSATVEAVIWLPILFVIFGLIIDTSTIYGNRTLVLKVVQDENRAYAVRKYLTTTEVQNKIKARIASISPTALVTSTVVDAKRIRTTVSLPATEIDALGMVPLFTGLTVSVRAEHLIEGI